jgi:hypothetical protein
MKRTVGLTALVALALVPMVVGTTPTNDPTAGAPIERLIQQLGHPDFRVRQAAVQAIEGMGPEVLEALRQAQNHEDAEVRSRVTALLPAKERAAILAPKRVTVQMPKGKVRQAIQEIAKQTGYKIEVWPDAGSNGSREDQVFDFQFHNTPFWEALDTICQQGGVVLQMGYGNEGLRLHFQDSFVPYIHRTGPYRVVAHGFHYGKSNDFSVIARNGQNHQNRSEYLNLNISVVVEPKLPLLGLGQGTVTEAVDDQNRSMLLPNHGMHYHTSYGGYKSYSQQTQVALVLPSKESKEVKYLRGVIPVTLLVEQKAAVVVDNLMTVKGNRKFKTADTDLEIEKIEQPGGNKQVQIKMSIRDTNKDTPTDYSWCNSLYQRVELQDAKGNKYQPQGFNWENQEPKFVRGNFSFGDPGNAPNLGPPAKLVYYTWVMTQDQVTFEFRKLPLP